MNPQPSQLSSTFGKSFLQWIEQDFDRFCSSVAETNFQMDRVVLWKMRAAARIIHGMCPRIEVTELQDLLLKAWGETKLDKTRFTAFKTLLAIFDDPRALGYAFGYTAWFCDFISDDRAWGQLSPKLINFTRKVLRPWSKKHVPRFRAFLSERWIAGIHKGTHLEQGAFSRHFHGCLDHARELHESNWNQDWTLWKCCFVFVGWFEIVRHSSIRMSYDWLGRFMSSSQIGSLESFQKYCGPRGLGISSRK